MSFRKPVIAYALGGGGARGLAHAGAIAVLHQDGIVPSFVVGTSMGAIVGASYALHTDPVQLGQAIRECLHHDALARIESIARSVRSPEQRRQAGRVQHWLQRMELLYLWNRQALDSALVDGATMDELIHRMVGDASFGMLSLRFYAMAYDLRAGESVVIGEGNLARALEASSAIPGFFEPVRDGESILVDGSVEQVIPTHAARQLGADIVIAMDAGTPASQSVPRSTAEVFERVSSARHAVLRKANRGEADVAIIPEVSDFHWSEFSRAEDCMAAGEQAARDVLDDVRRCVRENPVKAIRRRFRTGPPQVAKVVSIGELDTPRGTETST
jgi:NTE family protein